MRKIIKWEKALTIAEAKNKIVKLSELSQFTEDEEFLYIESLKFMIDKANDEEAMMLLGGYYYEKQSFDLALKYYDMATLKKYPPAYMCLGYIWYYGRTGNVDYKKAYENFYMAMESGDLVATYKVADMYKNGYYVEKDYSKYKKIIEALYKDVKGMKDVFAPIPEIFTRLAKIRIEENKNADALSLLAKAKEVLAIRISINPFFGNFTIMKWLIKDLYKVKDFNKKDFDFYDLYYLLGNEAKVAYSYNGKDHMINSIIEDGELVINFDSKWYRTIDDFMQKASIGNDKLCKIYYDLENFRIL